METNHVQSGVRISSVRTQIAVIFVFFAVISSALPGPNVNGLKILNPFLLWNQQQIKPAVTPLVQWGGLQQNWNLFASDFHWFATVFAEIQYKDGSMLIYPFPKADHFSLLLRDYTANSKLSLQIAVQVKPSRPILLRSVSAWVARTYFSNPLNPPIHVKIRRDLTNVPAPGVKQLPSISQVIHEQNITPKDILF